MPRNMSFSMTTQAILDETKTVTRRIGWWNLKPGDLLWACEKCIGLKKGEKVRRLKLIRVVSVHQEALWEFSAWDDGPWDDSCVKETTREGFPGLTPRGFIAMFCAANHCTDEILVNRIEFEYVKEET